MDRPRTIMVDGIAVEVIRKRITRLNLRVCPPDGSVRVSAPLHVGDDAVSAFVSGRIDWIERHRAAMRKRVRPTPLQLVTGEELFVGGLSYRLAVEERLGRPGVRISEAGTLALTVRPGADRDARMAVLEGWLRVRLREQVGALVAVWEPALGVRVSVYGIRKMRTRWGSCNTRAGRIWLSLELATKGPECVEYVVVHELVHLLERRHDARFWGLMDQFLPGWRASREELNGGPRDQSAR